jgi:mannose-6-phosphate isomerase-like protein (cupin superfamily)
MSLVGKVYDGGAVRLEVVATAEETGGRHHEMRATYAPDSPLPPAHLHPEQDERFEVLEGVLTFLVDGEQHLVGSGETLEVPRGAVHQVRNAGEVPAVAMWQTRPALRTAEFHDAVHTTTAARDWDGLRTALQEYRDVFRMVPDPFADD